MPIYTYAQLQVATIEREPFAIPTANNDWSGFSLDLRDRIASKLGIEYEIVAYTVFADMLEAVEKKEVDMAIANISITSAREKVMDFSHPIYDSGLQFLERSPPPPNLLNLFLHGPGMKVVIVLVGLILLHFLINTYGSYIMAIPSSGVLMSLRVIGGGIMLVHVSNYLGGEVSAHDEYEQDVHALVKGKRIGAAKGTTMSAYLDKEGVSYTVYDDFQDSLAALEEGEVDTILSSAAVGKYYASHEGLMKVHLLGTTFSPDKLAIAFPSRYPLIEKINKTLLELKEGTTYAYLQELYFDETY